MLYKKGKGRPTLPVRLHAQRLCMLARKEARQPLVWLKGCE